MTATIIRTSILLISVWVTPVGGAEAPPLDPVRLAEWLAARDPPLVLDVRGRIAYLQGTVPGALDGGTDPAGFLPDGRGGDAVLILSAEVPGEPWATRLADFGYRVRVLAGGMPAWRAAGLAEEVPEAGFARPGTIPFVIPRGICELNEPAQVFD